jgi:hypothetical protein
MRYRLSHFSSHLISVLFVISGLGSSVDCLAQSEVNYNGWNLAQNSNSAININGHELTPEQRQELIQIYGAAPIPGDWWYDAKTGWYGLMGGPLMGNMNPGHDFGAMPVDASQGDSDVFINGRQLPTQELQMYRALFGQIAPGRYWMDASGQWGIEDGTTQEQVQAQPTPPPQPSPAAGGYENRLIGVFEGEAISSGSGSYFNTQMNWVFNADGSVIYGSQGHYSGSQTGYDGNYDWTASGQTDANTQRGRWSTSGKLLTIQWEDGDRTHVAYGIEPDGTLVFRDASTGELINYFPRVR